MIDENRKCRDYLDYPEVLVEYVAEKLNIPFSSRRIWAGMTIYAQFIPDFNNRTNAFVYAPFTNKFVIAYPNYNIPCNKLTIKEVIDRIIESIKEYQQHIKQRRIDAIVSAAASFEA